MHTSGSIRVGWAGSAPTGHRASLHQRQVPFLVHNPLSQARGPGPGVPSLAKTVSSPGLLSTFLHRKSCVLVGLGIGPSLRWMVAQISICSCLSSFTPSSLTIRVSFPRTCLLAFSLCSPNLKTWPQMPQVYKEDLQTPA